MQLNIFLFLSIVFLLTFLLGILLKKIHIPWIFAALLLGIILAIYNPFEEITSSSTFDFLAKLGMYLLLFIIGFEIDLKKMKSHGKFIIKGTFFITCFAAIFGGLIFYFIFGCDLLISFILGLTFTTVGESILIPILDEFEETNKPIGQTIIGIGTLDDMIEIFCLIFVICLIGSDVHGVFHITIIIISIFVLFILTIGFIKLKKTGKKFKFMNIETLFFFVIFTMFLFIGIGLYAEAASLGALLAGISLKTFIPEERLKLIESELKTMCYGFFAPIFFLSVGITMDIKYLIIFPLLIILVVSVSIGVKIFASYICGKKELGVKNSLIVGIGLSVKFSTSIVIIVILYHYKLIDASLYSILIASSIILTLIVPILLSYLLTIKNSENLNQEKETKSKS